MPKKKTAKLRLDANELAFRTVRAALGEGERPHPPGEGPKNPEAVARGSKGAKQGGKKRMAKLTADEREALAQTAAMARWKKG